MRLDETLRKHFDSKIRFSEDQQPRDISCCIDPREKFAEAARVMKSSYALLAAEWAADEPAFGRGFGIYACYRYGSEYLIVKIEAPASDPVFPSITGDYAAAYRFERQIQSLMGLTPAGHPDSRPWIKHEDWPVEAWPLRKSFDASKKLKRVPGEYRWIRAEGEGI